MYCGSRHLDAAPIFRPAAHNRNGEREWRPHTPSFRPTSTGWTYAACCTSSTVSILLESLPLMALDRTRYDTD